MWARSNSRPGDEPQNHTLRDTRTGPFKYRGRMIAALRCHGNREKPLARTRRTLILHRARVWAAAALNFEEEEVDTATISRYRSPLHSRVHRRRFDRHSRRRSFAVLCRRTSIG